MNSINEIKQNIQSFSSLKVGSRFSLIEKDIDTLGLAQNVELSLIKVSSWT